MAFYTMPLTVILADIIEAEWIVEGVRFVGEKHSE